MESALTGEYADMVKEHFMKLVTPNDHKFLDSSWGSMVRWFICICS